MTEGGSAQPSQFVRSALWAVLAAVSFAIMMTSVRYMDGKFDAFEIVFFRALIGVFIVIPLVTRSGFDGGLHQQGGTKALFCQLLRGRVIVYAYAGFDWIAGTFSAFSAPNR